MANKYTRKGQDAPPVEDELVSFSARTYDALLPHARNIGIGVAALVAVIVVVWIFQGWRLGGREEATEMFGHAAKIYDAELLPESTTDGKDAPKPEAKSDDEVTRYKTAKERAEATLAELDKLQNSHGSSSVTDEAVAFRAGVLYDLGRLDEARAAASKFEGEVGKDNPVRVLAREEEGLVLEQQGKLDDAIAVYKDVETQGGDFFLGRARLDEARVMAKKGDTAGAKDLYKKILDKAPTGPLHEDAQNRLASLGG